MNQSKLSPKGKLWWFIFMAIVVWIFVLLSLAAILTGCNTISTTDEGVVLTDTLAVDVVDRDCMPWQQPDRHVQDVDFWTHRGATFVVYTYPCNGASRLVTYQVRWRRCGPVYTYEFRDTCR
jgi:hypothetical protein